MSISDEKAGQLLSFGCIDNYLPGLAWRLGFGLFPIKHQ